VGTITVNKLAGQNLISFGRRLLYNARVNNPLNEDIKSQPATVSFAEMKIMSGALKCLWKNFLICS
jgi:hypothetical protein